MKPCFGYIRVSTKEQADGASLDAQKDAITAFASQNNLNVVKWFEEQETASKAGRPLFETMRQELLRGRAQGVIIHRIDRSSRNYTDWAHIDELSRGGVKVYFAADGLDFESTGGRLMADIQMVLAAHYSRNLSFEVKKGLYGRIKQGHYPFKAPVGYLDNGAGNLKTIDPIKGPLVRQAFELYASGEYSVSSLTQEMARRGLTGWIDRPVVRSNMATILRNPFYIGKMIVRGTLYDAAHQPLISAAQFQRVAQIKAQRNFKKDTKHQMLFRALLTCADCKKTMTGERQKNHIYYRCHTANCPNLSIREDRVTEEIWRALRKIQLSTSDTEQLGKRIRSWLKAATPDELNSSIKLRIAGATSRLDRLTDLLVDGTIEKQSYELRKQNTQFELEQLREQARQMTDQKRSEADLESLLEMANDLSTIFRTGSSAERRKLLKNCASKISVRQGTVRIKKADWLQEVTTLPKQPDQTPSAKLLERSRISGL